MVYQVLKGKLGGVLRSIKGMHWTIGTWACSKKCCLRLYSKYSCNKIFTNFMQTSHYLSRFP